MARLRATIDITGLEVFHEMLEILVSIVNDPNVPQCHKDNVAAWIDGRKTKYRLNNPVLLERED